jgi:hypothetical protein
MVAAAEVVVAAVAAVAAYDTKNSIPPRRLSGSLIVVHRRAPSRVACLVSLCFLAGATSPLLLVVTEEEE